MHSLCINSAKSGIYNLADTKSRSTVELVKIINEVLKKSPKLWKVNKKLVIFIAKVCGGLGLPFSTQKMNKLTGNYEVSNNKILKELQVALPLSSKEGLVHTLASFKNK